MWYRIFFTDYFVAWLLLVLMGLLYRPLTPIDETRAVSVAWEMWLRHDFLVPHLNGEPYSHKPPMLQWCIHLLWLIFGVNSWTARMVAPLFALGNLFLTARLARQLWPDARNTQKLAPWLLLAMPIWAVWTSLTLYDMMVTFFTLLGLLGIARAASSERTMTWGLVGLAIGGGILAKGPVILLLILPPALLAPWWQERKPEAGWGRWYRSIGLATLMGAVIGLAWAIPAGFAGGDDYRRLIFWGQSAGRIANSFAHKRPFWWYLELLPALLFPWIFWPPLWRAIKRNTLDAGARFCLIHAGFVLAVFSLISGKQLHYLLPAFPAVALFSARMLKKQPLIVTRDDQGLIAALLLVVGLVFAFIPMLERLFGTPELSNEAANISERAPLIAKLFLIAAGAFLFVWSPRSTAAAARAVTGVIIAALFTAHLVYREVGWKLYAMQPFADRVADAEHSGAPIVHWHKYNGDFTFLGRLRQPIREFDDKQALIDWLGAQPGAYLIVVAKARPGLNEDGAEYAQFYRGSRRIMLWRASEFLARRAETEKLLD